MLIVRRNAFAAQCTHLTRYQKRRFHWEPLAVVAVLTESLQAAHAYSGVPWWALIPITTFTLRSVWTLPLAILQRRRVQRQNEWKPVVMAMNPVLRFKFASVVQRAKSKIATAQVSNNIEILNKALDTPAVSELTSEQIVLLSAKQARKDQKRLFKEHNLQLYKNFLLPAFQIPLWACMSLTMRDLSGWSTWLSSANKPLDADLYTQGLAWFQDLTLADPVHVFPILIGIVALCNVEWTVRSYQLHQLLPRKSSRPTITDAMTNLSRMMIVFLMAISLHAPVALSLYWFSSQVFSLFQNVVMDLTMPISFTPRTRTDSMRQAGKQLVNLLNRV